MRYGPSWRPGALRPATLALVVAGLLLLLAAPAAAVNPVLDPEDDADVAASLAEATEVQDVCYGYLLTVSDAGTGEWGGTYASSSAGEGVAASSAPECREGTVELVAQISYTSDWSEAEDSAGWDVVSTVPGVDIGDVEDLGLSSGDLLDDAASGTTLLNAVLALPRLASEQAGLPPVVLEPNPSPLPEGARPNGSPGSDWVRENGLLLGLCVAVVLGGVLTFLAASSRSRTGPRRAPRIRSLGPPTDPWRS